MQWHDTTLQDTAEPEGLEIGRWCQCPVTQCASYLMPSIADSLANKSSEQAEGIRLEAQEGRLLSATACQTDSNRLSSGKQCAADAEVAE